MRTWKIVSLILVLIVSLTGCTAAEKIAEQGKPVKTVVLKEGQEPVRLTYFGITDTSEMKKYSFKVGGKLKHIAVEKGQKVAKGQLLAELDSTDLQFAVKAAEYTRVKAESAFKDAADLYGKVKTLQENGASAQRDVDLARLDMEVKEASLNQAKIDCQYKQSVVSDAKLYADIDGYVVDQLNQVGEIVGAGYPVLIVRSGAQVVKVGLTQNDITRVKKGTKATVLLGGSKEIQVRGEVSAIDQYPDPESRTYMVEIALAGGSEEAEFYLGSTSEVWLEVGETKGIWIPLAAIQNDGQDFVYVVNEDRVLRQDVKIMDVFDTRVRITGLEEGQEMVIAGMKNLADGALILKEAEKS